MTGPSTRPEGSIVVASKILDAPARAIPRAIPANVHQVQTESTNTQTAMIHQTMLNQRSTSQSWHIHMETCHGAPAYKQSRSRPESTVQTHTRILR